MTARWTLRQFAYALLFILPVAVAFTFVEQREGCRWATHVWFAVLGTLSGCLGRFWGSV